MGAFLDAFLLPQGDIIKNEKQMETRNHLNERRAVWGSCLGSLNFLSPWNQERVVAPAPP